MSAKDIIVKPISAKDANAIVRSIHYSGKVDTRSQLHFGIFLNGKCGGAMQFGPPMDKRKVIDTVKNTSWNSMMDLHRMAFADWLPRNSESRAIAIAFRLIRKSYPHIEWLQSYADASQCGDGAIYRASGFSLIGIKKNTSMYLMPDGEVCCKIIFEPGFQPNAGKNSQKAKYGKTGSETAGTFLKRIGAKQITGFQLRYIYFLNPAARSRLTVPILPFTEIQRRGAGMYLGKPKRAGSETSDTPAFQAGEGGSLPTPALHSQPSPKP
ncbi:hypothetical protein UFOVP612_13 [uncultured Caudovirales phage]|uniref:Uncharacterized protein n=1 Tax=uncultured Caudovirales phage TaxID=2100421 RepID=A0A6J5N3H1_9CAUD|nr:hypothetical protein UFOVP612_13 [uncultured Caudovirales phage]